MKNIIITFFLTIGVTLLAPSLTYAGGHEQAAVHLNQLRYVIDDYPPKEIYLEYDDGSTHFAGIDVDIVQELAKRLGVKVKFSPCPFKRCLQLMKDGNADIQTSLLKRADREQFLHYLNQPYELATPKAFYFLKGEARNVRKYDDLYTLKRGIGLLLGSKFFKQFDEDTKLKKIEFKNVRQAIRLLDLERIDSFISTELTGDYFVTQLGMKDRFEKSSFKYAKSTQSYVVISKKSPFMSRIDEINRILEQIIKEGFVSKTKEKYFKYYGIK